ncbi:hypothetical protein WG954_16005 [Lacibacter sp. H375]|uniref:hypothetical protein n=1 Tax=Lacibacter sp. H375 TaxID=3133424 RepID=UPI0030C083A3
MKIESSNFKRLVGIWNTEGTILSGLENSTLHGTDSYEFILDGTCMLHKADVMMGNEKSETFEIITLDDSVEQIKMQYYNSKGESGIMKGSLINNDFKIEGDKLKFVGMLNSDNSLLAGKWYLQSAENVWTEFIELQLTKQN